MDYYKQQSKLFKALMHPVRLAILDLLRDGEECVCHMEAQLGYRQAYISQQLAVLRDAGLIKDRRDGWNIYYSIAKPEIFQITDVAGSLVEPVQQPNLSLFRTQNENSSCPCPKCSANVVTA